MLSPLDINVLGRREHDDYPSRTHEHSACPRQVRAIHMLGLIGLHRTRSDPRRVCSCRRRVP
jgi:hypothetical protein